MTSEFPLFSFTNGMDFREFFKFTDIHEYPIISIQNADAKIHTFLKMVMCSSWEPHPDYFEKQPVCPRVTEGYRSESGRIEIQFRCKDVDKVFAYLDYLTQRTHTFEFWE